jgi:hypothetical protein
VTRETVAAIALCLVTAMAVVAMVESHRHEEVVICTTPTTVVQSLPRSAGVPPADPAASSLPAAKANYVGNINSKKFHRLSCRYASCTNCKAKFATRQEAIDAGFDPCGTCDP